MSLVCNQYFPLFTILIRILSHTMWVVSMPGSYIRKPEIAKSPLGFNVDRNYLHKFWRPRNSQRTSLPRSMKNIREQKFYFESLKRLKSLMYLIWGGTYNVKKGPIWHGRSQKNSLRPWEFQSFHYISVTYGPGMGTSFPSSTNIPFVLCLSIMFVPQLGIVTRNGHHIMAAWPGGMLRCLAPGATAATLHGRRGRGTHFWREKVGKDWEKATKMEDFNHLPASRLPFRFMSMAWCGHKWPWWFEFPKYGNLIDAVHLLSSFNCTCCQGIAMNRYDLKDLEVLPMESPVKTTSVSQKSSTPIKHGDDGFQPSPWSSPNGGVLKWGVPQKNGWFSWKIPTKNGWSTGA